MVVLGLQTKPDKSLKDTATNIRNTGEFVVNLVDKKMVKKMVVCAADFPEGESELLHAELQLFQVNSRDKCISDDFFSINASELAKDLIGVFNPKPDSQ